MATRHTVARACDVRPLASRVGWACAPPPPPPACRFVGSGMGRQRQSQYPSSPTVSFGTGGARRATPGTVGVGQTGDVSKAFHEKSSTRRRTPKAFFPSDKTRQKMDKLWGRDPPMSPGAHAPLFHTHHARTWLHRFVSLHRGVSHEHGCHRAMATSRHCCRGSRRLRAGPCAYDAAAAQSRLHSKTTGRGWRAPPKKAKRTNGRTPTNKIYRW